MRGIVIADFFFLNNEGCYCNSEDVVDNCMMVMVIMVIYCYCCYYHHFCIKFH